MQAYFGVTPQQSAASGFAAFDAVAGTLEAHGLAPASAGLRLKWPNDLMARDAIVCVDDAELEVLQLRRDGLTFTSLRVDTREAFLAALDEFKPHIVIADYKLPASPRQADVLIVAGTLTTKMAPSIDCSTAGASKAASGYMAAPAAMLAITPAL